MEYLADNPVPVSAFLQPRAEPEIALVLGSASISVTGQMATRRSWSGAGSAGASKSSSRRAAAARPRASAVTASGRATIGSNTATATRQTLAEIVAGLPYCYHSSVHVIGAHQWNGPAVLQPRQREKLAWGTEDKEHVMSDLNSIRS